MSHSRIVTQYVDKNGMTCSKHSEKLNKRTTCVKADWIDSAQANILKHLRLASTPASNAVSYAERAKKPSKAPTSGMDCKLFSSNSPDRTLARLTFEKSSNTVQIDFCYFFASFRITLLLTKPSIDLLLKMAAPNVGTVICVLIWF
jgi:hypothetical protein